MTRSLSVFLSRAGDRVSLCLTAIALAGMFLLAGCRVTDRPAVTVTTVDAQNGVRIASMPAVMVGGFGVGAGQVQSVGPVAVTEDGQLYIADNTQRRITVISAETGPLPTRSYLPGLANPLVPGDTVHVVRAMEWHGPTLYLVDRARIWAIPRSAGPGAQASAIEPEGGVAGVRDIEVAADGSLYLLSERGIRILSPSGGLRDSILVRGETPPRCVAFSFGPDSNLYISTRSLNHVVVYNRSGQLVKRIGAGTFAGEARGIAVDQFGNVFVRDEKEAAIRAFSADGTYRGKIGARGSGPGQMLSAEQLVIDRGRRVLVVPDPTNYRVQVFDLTGRRAEARDLVTHTPAFERTRRPYHITLGMGVDASTQLQIAWKTAPASTGSMVVYVPVDGGDISAVDWSEPGVKTARGSSTAFVSNIGPYRAHSVALTALEPGTRYAYRVGDGSSEGWSETNTFLTPPASPESLVVAILGDSRNRMDVWGNIVNRAAAFDPAFIVTTGDLVSNGEDFTHWDPWFHEADAVFKKTPFMTTPGNHERESPNYYLSFEMPRNAPAHLQEKCFSFDVGQTHWISLNTQVDLAPQTAWLEEDLRKNTKPWVFVFLHRPAYAAHASRGDGNRDVREAWGGLFDQYGVDVVWQGHDHYYHRSKPIRAARVVPEGRGPIYITTGGAGAPLYQMKPNQYTEVGEITDHFCMMTLRGNHCEVVVYRADGSVADRFSVRDCPRETAR